ncbi:hypothetical protein ACFU3E_06330 [Streptomyces sp. NPDC057424]|uniref:hypothetical protein n=1 Tax=Streptomyces sp. NPDC057424 TaxID=3346127 RepID=UPI0036B2499C
MITSGLWAPCAGAIAVHAALAASRDGDGEVLLELGLHAFGRRHHGRSRSPLHDGPRTP